jgi:steroid delta-isomerase-like uncharacterized protein
MSTETNKALVRKFYEEIDKGNLDAMDDLVAEDYIDHSPPPFPGLLPGREGLKQGFQIFWEATPGYHCVEDQIAEDDKVVTRLTAYGKHEGDLPGAPRTGNELKMTAITIHRIADGKLVEKWSEKDILRFLRQIGVLPEPPREQGASK